MPQAVSIWNAMQADDRVMAMSRCTQSVSEARHSSAILRAVSTTASLAVASSGRTWETDMSSFSELTRRSSKSKRALLAGAEVTASSRCAVVSV